MKHSDTAQIHLSVGITGVMLLIFFAVFELPVGFC
jgi:hypothetical protein